MRVKITISYNGALFMGSQPQKNEPNTVLGLFCDALQSLKITDKPVASGRTDRGVHATGQVLHVDLPPYWSDLKKLKRSLGFQLPPSIHVKRVEWVDHTFHARYSAKKRVYRYILSDANANPFEESFVTFTKELDTVAINDAMQLFVGTHNFEMFKKSGSEVKSYERTIYKAFAYRHKKYLILHFEANGFLRSQIRLMVGFLLAISTQQQSNKTLKEQITCKKQHHRKLAPCNGLYLAKIKY
jgi:tRNA pseudouridine38-40 synthase